jgi:proteic killer suppression protein
VTPFSVLTLYVKRETLYIPVMIKTWRNTATRKLYESGKSKFPGIDIEAAQDLMDAVNAAATLSDLSPLRSVHLHALKGARKGQWAMTINAGWRLVFRFKDGDAYDVEITDYH